MPYRRYLIAALVGTALGWSTLPTVAEITVSTVTLDRAIFFTLPDGNEVVAEAGTYTVQPGGDSRLHLIAKKSSASLEILAAPMSHEQVMDVPMALALGEEGREEALHVILLLPGGSGWDAMGYSTTIRGRGTVTFPLNAARIQSAMNQKLSAAGLATPEINPGLDAAARAAEAARKAAERQAELQPEALLARIQALERFISCLQIQNYGTGSSEARPALTGPPGPGSFPVRFDGYKCPRL